MKIKGDAQKVLALGAVAIAVYWILSREALAAAKAVGAAVNPVDRDNVFNSGVDAVGKSLSGESGWTLGGWVYDITNPDAGWDPDVESEK